MPITRSVTKEITASARSPMAAAIPRIRARTELTVAVSNPTARLKERPASVLFSISLPIQSVPNGYSRQGARFLLEKSVLQPYHGTKRRLPQPLPGTEP